MNLFYQQLILTVVTAITSGVTTGLIIFLIQRHDAKHDLLMGLGHDAIFKYSNKYLKRGHIYRDEYENLHDYIYVPYSKRGGNGTGKRMMEEIEKLEMRER